MKENFLTDDMSVLLECFVALTSEVYVENFFKLMNQMEFSHEQQVEAVKSALTGILEEYQKELERKEEK